MQDWINPPAQGLFPNSHRPGNEDGNYRTVAQVQLTSPPSSATNNGHIVREHCRDLRDKILTQGLRSTPEISRSELVGTAIPDEFISAPQTSEAVSIG